LKKLTIIIIIIILFFSILLFILSFYIPTAEILKNRVGPAFFPKMILLGIMTLSIIFLFQTLKRPIEDKNVRIIVPKNRNRLILIAFITVLSGLLFNIIGGFLTIFFIIISYLWVWNIRKGLTLIIYSVGITLIIYLIFHLLLSVRLPKGIFGGIV